MQKGLHAMKTLRLSKQCGLLVDVWDTPLGTFPLTPGSGGPLNSGLCVSLHISARYIISCTDLVGPSVYGTPGVTLNTLQNEKFELKRKRQKFVL